MSVTGAADGPAFRVGVAIAGSGRRPARRSGASCSPYARATGPSGDSTWTSACSTASSLLTYHASMHLTTATSLSASGIAATIAPYDTPPVPARPDGEIFLAVGNDDQFHRFCEVTGLHTLLDEERFATNPARVVHHSELRERLMPGPATGIALTGTKSSRRAGVPCGAVLRDVLTRCPTRSSWRGT